MRFLGHLSLVLTAAVALLFIFGRPVAWVEAALMM